jgi:hypothetical protein
MKSMTTNSPFPSSAGLNPQAPSALRSTTFLFQAKMTTPPNLPGDEIDTGLLAKGDLDLIMQYHNQVLLMFVRGPFNQDSEPSEEQNDELLKLIVSVNMSRKHYQKEQGMRECRQAILP